MEIPDAHTHSHTKPDKIFLGDKYTCFLAIAYILGVAV